jgi:SAM-dependent methyltransferase
MALALAKATAKKVLGRLTQASQIEAYLKDNPYPKLNIGCGYNVVPGWMNVDLTGGRGGTIFMDALKTFPVPEGTFDAILCEHMVEHLPKEAGPVLAREAFRALKPGGRMRIVTPDLENMARLALDSSTPQARRYLEFVAGVHGRETITGADALNYIFYEYGHRHIYTVASLTAVMREAGFTEIVETRAGHPAAEVFLGAEGHSNFMGAENNATEAFALEARKPSA